MLRGGLLTKPDEGIVYGLLLDERPAALVEESEETPVVNIATDLVMEPKARSMADPGGSAFNMHMPALGDDRFLDWKTKLEQFDQLAVRDWLNVVRWWGYYTSDQWNLFDSHARDYWSDDWPDDPSDLALHDSIHRALEVIFFHVCGSTYVDLKLIARESFPGQDFEKMKALANSLSESGLLGSAQIQLFEIIVRNSRIRQPQTIQVVFGETAIG